MDHIIQRLLRYLNPIDQLGSTHYSFLFPLITMIITILGSEFYVQIIAKNPNSVGTYIIFITVALIIYFSFRDGIRGGLITSLMTIMYYIFIIYSRHYSGSQRITGFETTFILGILYIIFALTIGWLKQTIDRLIERESDEKRRMLTIIQQLPVGVLITDSQGVLTERNKKVDEILGIKIPIGFHFGVETLQDTRIPMGPANPSHSPLVKTLKTGRAVLGKEYSYEKKDGKRVFLQVNSSAVENKTGKIIAAASIITDVTQQKEQEIRKDDFVNMASHELKTPITSMKLYVDVLEKQLKVSSNPKAAKTLRSIKNQVDKLQELVNDLLDVSRLQTGKLNLTTEDFRLDQLIEETIEDLQGTTKNQKIILTKKSPIVVRADKFRVYQVFTNFITNAVKYSPPDTEIKVQVKRGDGRAVVSVRDHGIGIDKEQQKKIFEKLYQVTDPKEKTFPGLGMGLYISKEIIKRHKGDIWVESEKNKGSIFYFSLPITKKKMQ